MRVTGQHIGVPQSSGVGSVDVGLERHGAPSDDSSLASYSLMDSSAMFKASVISDGDVNDGIGRSLDHPSPTLSVNTPLTIVGSNPYLRSTLSMDGTAVSGVSQRKQDLIQSIAQRRPEKNKPSLSTSSSGPLTIQRPSSSPGLAIVTDLRSPGSYLSGASGSLVSAFFPGSDSLAPDASPTDDDAGIMEPVTGAHVRRKRKPFTPSQIARHLYAGKSSPASTITIPTVRVESSEAADMDTPADPRPEGQAVDMVVPSAPPPEVPSIKLPALSPSPDNNTKGNSLRRSGSEKIAAKSPKQRPLPSESSLPSVTLPSELTGLSQARSAWFDAFAGGTVPPSPIHHSRSMASALSTTSSPLFSRGRPGDDAALSPIRTKVKFTPKGVCAVEAIPFGCVSF